MYPAVSQADVDAPPPPRGLLAVTPTYAVEKRGSRPRTVVMAGRMTVGGRARTLAEEGTLMTVEARVAA